ncbi:MAG: Gfo/Idh/MocA family oxidoreductase [Tannerellaceae bacterium]|jgi:predicted dehydrogenase|nr:Gfo/Idh/MocA family oxidoreductase [Tannerellaceae bacterium]
MPSSATGKNAKVRFAVVGCGHIGKRHAEMICRDPDAELVALCDNRSPNTLAIDDYDVPFYSSIESLLDGTPHADVINICTPNGLHAAMAILAMEAGKHVVIEKPMALTVTDAKQIICTSERLNRRVFCVMQNRYSPPSIWLKETVDSGILGQIYMVQLNCYWNRDERYYLPNSWHGDAKLDGGTLFTQFSHFIDILYWVFGDIHRIQAHLTNFNHSHLTDFEDSGIVYFEFVNGIGCGSINYSTSVWEKNMESSILILAENGSLKIGGQYLNQVSYCHIKNYQMPLLPPTNAGNDYGAYMGSAQNHHYVIRNVVRALAGLESITATATEGLKVVDIIQRVYES